jgi:hypothetical protein
MGTFDEAERNQSPATRSAGISLHNGFLAIFRSLSCPKRELGWAPLEDFQYVRDRNYELVIRTYPC